MDEQSNVEQILRATLSFIKTKIISNENDKLGIVLYGSGKKGGAAANQNSLNFEHIHVLHGLDIPDASLIKQLETKIVTFESDHGCFNESEAVQAQEPDQINSSVVNNMSSASLNPAVSSLLSQDKVGSTSSQFAGSSLLPNQRAPLFEALWICHQEFKQVEK